MIDVMAYDPSAWHDLFVATAGAAAALAGLLFVAVSINVERILQYAWLPVRAAETLAALVGQLLLAILVLIPAESTTPLGIELAVLGLGLTGVAVVALVRTRLARGGTAGAVDAWPAVIAVVAALPIAVAGVSLLAGAGGGLTWLVPAIVVGFAGAVLNAWVLLIEILR